MKIDPTSIRLDENKIYSRYVIFNVKTSIETFNRNGTESVPPSAPTLVGLSDVFTTPTLSFELAKIDTSGC